MAENEDVRGQLDHNEMKFECPVNVSAAEKINLAIIPDNQNEECASSDLLGEWNSEDANDEILNVDDNTENMLSTQEITSTDGPNIEVAMIDKVPFSNGQEGLISNNNNSIGNLIQEDSENVESPSPVTVPASNVQIVYNIKLEDHESNTESCCIKEDHTLEDKSERALFHNDAISSDEQPVQDDIKMCEQISSQEYLKNGPENEEQPGIFNACIETVLINVNAPETTHKISTESTQISPNDEDLLFHPEKCSEANLVESETTGHINTENMHPDSQTEENVIVTESKLLETETFKKINPQNQEQVTSEMNNVRESEATNENQNFQNASENEDYFKPGIETNKTNLKDPESNARISSEIELGNQQNSTLETGIPSLSINLQSEPAPSDSVSNSSTENAKSATETKEPSVNYGEESSSSKKTVEASPAKEQEPPAKPVAQPVATNNEKTTAAAKESPSTQNTPAASKKGFAQLEQMSHEDLLKQCKRQLLFLQKTKMKTDDLSRNLQELQNENKLLKEASLKPGVSGDLLQRLQCENDRLLDAKESQAEVVAQLGKDMSKLVADLASCKEQLEEGKTKCTQLKDLLSSAESEKKRQDTLILDLQSQIIVLRSGRDSDSKKTGEMRSEAKLWEGKYLSMEVELKMKCQEIADLNASLDRIKQELEQGKVLTLEIGDYERSLSDLHAQLDQKNQSLEELNLQVQKQKQEQEALSQQIEHLEQQCLSEEGRSAHLKETLETTRHQLTSEREEQNQLSIALKEIKQQKEDVLASKEELQYQLSVSSSRLLLIESELKQSRDQSEKLDISLKSRISSLSEELAQTRQELEASRKEFHNYKVRVHSVLKQQKSSGPASGQPITSLSILEEEDQKEQMEWTLELCKGKITQMTDQIGALNLERDSLQKEQEWLISKHNMQAQQMQEKETFLVERVEELKQQLDLNHSLWETEKKQLLQQQQNLTHEYEHRLCLLESEHQKHVSSLVNQLEQAQRGVHLYSPPADHRFNQQNSIFDLVPASQLSPSVDESFDICSQERQEGEGSECTDTIPVPAAFQTLVTSPASGLMPLERLLQAESNTSLCNQDPDMIAISMNTLQKKVDHISELLNESEASNLRLTEQTRLLKEEIRRLERNTERQKHSENLEYLKNIVLKFNTLPAGSERERLVPVISTLLKLSPEEQSQMSDAATQGVASGSNTGGNWGNYLHRWSGLA